jgi:hypothetical protein
MKRLFIGVAITLTIILISLVSVSCGSDSSSLLKSDHLVLIIDTSTYGYTPGDQIDVLFEEGDKFHLSDCFGDFDGSFSISGDELTLDFDDYPAYTITFVDDTHFTGAETDWYDTGTYQWVGG